MDNPEPRTEPREPTTFDHCILCGGEIYKGERCYRAQNGRVCHFCADWLPFREEIAGEDDT